MAGNEVAVTVTGRDKLTPELRKAQDGADGFGASLKNLGPIAAAAFAAVGAAAVGAGVGLFKVGETFDNAFDTIRIGTGATGEALEGLQDDFRAVFASVPADAGTAATAVADLNTRLGLTGDELQERSRQFIDLSRITGTDLASNIENLTRLFGDWGVASEDQEATLDAVFRASQSTGAGIDQLGRQMVQFGAPLRSMGFGFEESIALLGKFAREGVNTELVMGSLRIALGKMAREGEDAPTTFRRMVDEIAKMEDASEATALALELFGARAGPDMAAAIREGRFDVGELFDVVSSGSETIAAAAADTDDFSQSWQLFKNNALLAVEPVATRVFDLIGQGMAWLVSDGLPMLQQFGGWIQDNIIPTLTAFGELVAEVVRTIVIPFLKQLGERVAIEFAKFQRYYESDVKPAIDNIVAAVQWLVGEIEERWPMIWAVIEPVLNQVKTHVEFVIDTVKRVIATALDIIAGDWEGAWENVKAIVAGVQQFIEDTMNNVLDFLKGLGTLLFDVAKDLGSMIVDGIVAGIKALGGAIGSALADVIPDSISLPGLPSIPIPSFPGLAGGGVSSGLTWVGEAGPELVNFGSPARVFNARESREIAGAGSSPVVNVHVHVDDRRLADLIRVEVEDATALGAQRSGMEGGYYK